MIVRSSFICSGPVLVNDLQGHHLAAVVLQFPNFHRSADLVGVIHFIPTGGDYYISSFLTASNLFPIAVPAAGEEPEYRSDVPVAFGAYASYSLGPNGFIARPLRRRVGGLLSIPATYGL